MDTAVEVSKTGGHGSRLSPDDAVATRFWRDVLMLYPAELRAEARPDSNRRP
jgi:hypothetical protein